MRNNGIQIRVADILYGIIKHRFLIIAMTVAGLAVGAVLSGISYLQGGMSREYAISTSFSLNAQTERGMFSSGYDFPSYNDINMAEDLVDTVTYVMTSDRVLDEVIDSLELLGITPEDISDNLEFSQYNETQIIEVSLYWRSSEEGLDILAELNNIAPEVLTGTLGIGNVSVINNPTAEHLVGGSVNAVLWGYMALIGFVLGIGIIILELIMHPTLLNVKDIENVFDREVLCEVADDKAYFRERKSLLVEDDTYSDVEESFASMAHIIQNRMRRKSGPHIIYVTSALRGEGKTNVVANLAIQLSDLEKRVLMVDFDMKNPNLKNLFLNNFDYDHSLNALYTGDITETEAVTSLTGYLDILPTVYEKSAIPLDSSLFSVIKRIAKNYDYVLIDTASVGLTADPMSLSQIASAALFVVRYDTATIREISDALERIEKSGVSILGCVVNGVQVSERNIKNPAAEKEKVKRAEYRDENESAPLMNIGTAPAGDSKSADHNIQSLVAQFADEETENSDSDQGVTSSDGFVELLFQAESNEMNDSPEEASAEDKETKKDQE